MKYNKINNENEVINSVLSDIAKVANIENAEILQQIAKLVAQASVRVAELELEYNEDGAPFSVADMLEKI